jgi:hypothetical protein
VATKNYTLDFGSKVTYHPIQDGGSRHYEKTQTVITQSIFVRFLFQSEVTDRFQMAAAAMFEIQVNAIKWAITIRF